MRPTGPLHLGHYFGALETWLTHQNGNQYIDPSECFFLIADYQALGDYSDNVELIRDSVRQVTLDWLAVGLDPQTSAFVVQSYVPEHAELAMLLSTIARYNDLLKNPTLKSEMAQLSESGKTVTVAFATYPVSQVADILLPKATTVPVGEDQAPHLEYTNELARTFNRLYDAETFREIDIEVGRVPRLVGLDGQAKMSASLGNSIDLRDDEATLRMKIKGMVSDVTGNNPRLSATDPGEPDNNPAFLYFDALFGEDNEEATGMRESYRAGTISDGAVKDRLFEVLNEFLAPIRERRHEYEQQPDLITEALVEGSRREQAIAKETLSEVRDTMRISNY
jgi:tryptophanyl-tRNA synthetase